MKPHLLLVPIDFSENSLIALRFATQLCRGTSCSLILMHVHHEEDYREAFSENLGVEHLMELCQRQVAELHIPCRNILCSGDVVEEILAQSKKSDVSMIVMGTSGNSKKRDRLIGSNASSVVSKSEIPVLVIPESMPYKNISKIVVGIDPNLENEHTVQWIAESLAGEGIEIDLISAGSQTIAEEVSQYQLRLKEIIHSKSPECLVLNTFIPTVNVLSSLDAFIKDVDADLLVLTTHHRGIFERIFDPGITRRFALQSDIPVLAIPVQKVPVFFF
ncbi:MAG: universal stress protein [Bacteroidota bacterium]|jgi:nucleotide-binding universal stress UspA family protein